MKIKYLGTAAAEGFPALFCECENCKKARKWGGKNIRTRSQAIIDGKLLLDYPPDTYWHLTQHNIDILDAPYCLITHTHEDHFFPSDMCWMNKGFSHPPADWKFNLYGSCEVKNGLGNLPQQTNGILNFTEIKPFEPFTADKYTVTALKAVHSAPNALFYIISDGEKTILYAHDTDIFPKETWEYLEKTKPYFDLVSMDCTEGTYEELPYKGHMCLGTNKKCRDMMLEMGLADEKTKFILNHISHNGKDSVYNDFAPIAESNGFMGSYDGMEIEV